jgi:hypothetical protein
MTVDRFVEARVAALRYFFKATFGWHWHAVVARELGRKGRLTALQYRKRRIGKIATLKALEAVAIKHGWNPAGPLGLLRPPPEPTAILLSDLEARPRRY